MKLSRFGMLVAAAAAVMSISSAAHAWNYGDSWVIPLDPNKTWNGEAGLQGNGWNLETSGGAAENGGQYWWSSNYESTRIARYFFDASITGGDAPTSAEKFIIQTWVPAAHANAYNVIQVSFDGMSSEEGIMNPNIPWGGQFGTNHQWMDRHQGNQGKWVLAGPNPQSPGTVDGKGFVYAKQGSYFYVSTYGFYGPTDQYAVSAIKVTVVPEPGSILALGGSLLSMAGLVIRRRK
ncbi:MAG: PEP-CTERM sorting domain-containing protein [Armatimonadetes bacterium]|nr:PEP-CTERM sorting domain-containing protein [Armatimonadota bacterium]